MSKKHSSNSEQILCEKEGFAPRKFTIQQLEAMGQDPGGESYDGWKPTEAPKEPKELKDAKAAAAKSATSSKPKGKPTVVEGETSESDETKTTDSDASTETAESTGESNDLDSDGDERSDSSQGSQGDGKAE